MLSLQSILLSLCVLPAVCSQSSDPSQTPAVPEASARVHTTSLIIESTRRTLNITRIPSRQQDSGDQHAPAVTFLTPSAQLVPVTFILSPSDKEASGPLASSSSLWVCHTLQPLPAREVAYSRTGCSPMSTSTIPTTTRLGLEEAPGPYLLRSYLAPASLVVEPMSVVLGPGLEDFPVTMQLPRPSEEMASLARLHCTVFRDRIPQRVEGCAQKIVLEAQSLFERRLVGFLDAISVEGDSARASSNTGTWGRHVVQHHLHFSALVDGSQAAAVHQGNSLSSSPGAASGAGAHVEVDETILLSPHRSRPTSTVMDPSLCKDVHAHEQGPTGEGLARVQLSNAGQQPWPRLLCMTYTISPRHQDEVRGLTETWAGRCDGYLAMSNLTDLALPALSVPHDGPESYFNMWQKVRAIWQHVGSSRRLLEAYDFFFLGGDDVYLIPDNLRQLLVGLHATPDRAWYLGRRLTEEEGHSRWLPLYYQSGGAGYVLSREAVRRLVEEGLESSFCRPRDQALWEDVNVGYCMRFLGIEAADTRDSEGRETFHYQTPAFLVEHGRAQEISPHSVSFHYVRTRRSMLVIDALLYGHGAACPPQERPRDVLRPEVSTAA